MVELTLVMTLFGIMVGIVLVHGTYMYRAVVKQEIEKLALICRYLQHAAMMSNMPKALIFDRKTRPIDTMGLVSVCRLSVEFGVLSGAKGPPSNPTRQITVSYNF